MVVNFLIALVLVLAIQTFSGNSGIVTFGHVAFMGVGAYVAALADDSRRTSRRLLPALPGFLRDVELDLVPAVLAAGGRRRARRGRRSASR